MTFLSHLGPFTFKFAELRMLEYAREQRWRKVERGRRTGWQGVGGRVPAPWQRGGEASLIMHSRGKGRKEMWTWEWSRDQFWCYPGSSPCSSHLLLTPNMQHQYVCLPAANPTICRGLTLQGAHQQGEAHQEHKDVFSHCSEIFRPEGIRKQESTQGPSHKTGLYHKPRLGGAARRIPGNGLRI